MLFDNIVQAYFIMDFLWFINFIRAVDDLEGANDPRLGIVVPLTVLNPWPCLGKKGNLKIPKKKKLLCSTTVTTCTSILDPNVTFIIGDNIHALLILYEKRTSLKQKTPEQFLISTFQRSFRVFVQSRPEHTFDLVNLSSFQFHLKFIKKSHLCEPKCPTPSMMLCSFNFKNKYIS